MWLRRVLCQYHTNTHIDALVKSFIVEKAVKFLVIRLQDFPQGGGTCWRDSR